MGLLDECLERGTKEDFMEKREGSGAPNLLPPTLVRGFKSRILKLSVVWCAPRPPPHTHTSHQALHNLLPLCRRFHHLTVPFTPGPGRQSQNMINHAESWDTQETHKRPVPRGAQLTADLLCAGNRQASYSRTTANTPAFFHISHESCFKFSTHINLFFFSFYK